MGAAFLMMLIIIAMIYMRRVAKYNQHQVPSVNQQATSQERNSYAESYEVSSNVSSAHHMAIQVKLDIFRFVIMWLF